MSRRVEVEECGICCGYHDVFLGGKDVCLVENDEAGDPGKVIDKIEPDGFPKWCTGIDLDKERAKYQAALQRIKKIKKLYGRALEHIAEGVECPFVIWEECVTPAEERRIDGHGDCKKRYDGDEVFVLSCWDKYFAEQVKNSEEESA